MAATVNIKNVKANTASILLRFLAGRRRELGMSMRTLAKRSGLGVSTVQSILSGKETAELNSVLLIAKVLKVDLYPRNACSAFAARRFEAEKKAAKLAAMVQGTSGLEAQAVPSYALREIQQEIAAKLVSGPKFKLWAD